MEKFSPGGVKPERNFSGNQDIQLGKIRNIKNSLKEILTILDKDDKR